MLVNKLLLIINEEKLMSYNMPFRMNDLKQTLLALK